MASAVLPAHKPILALTPARDLWLNGALELAEQRKAMIAAAFEVSGTLSTFNEGGQCPACCIEFTQAWSFTDQGFIAGGAERRRPRLQRPRERPRQPVDDPE